MMGVPRCVCALGWQDDLGFILPVGCTPARLAQGFIVQLLRASAPVSTLELNKKASFRMAYLLGLLAMIKCSICSYQRDN